MEDYNTGQTEGQYFCEYCGKRFNTPVERKYRETYWGEFSQMFTDLYCPYCGSDDVGKEWD